MTDPQQIELEQAEALIAAEEEDLGIEWVGPGQGMNRAQRRAKLRQLKRLTRRPEACHSMVHPLTGAVTPYGAKRLKKRRAASKRARVARRRNRNV